MDPVLEYMLRRKDEIVAAIAELACIESPTREKASVDRAGEWVADRVAGVADIRRHKQTDWGDHLRIEFGLPGGQKDGQILGLGHLDTVYPLGALDTMPVREKDGRLWGPGVFDMKAGVVYFLFAARALRELDIPVRRRFVLQLNSEEEVGSPTSRPFTEEEARRSAAVLVAEPSFGPEGRLKTLRKGGGQFRITVHGRSAHAGLDFSNGASAIVELARQIQTIAGWTDLETGVTVNPGVISGGTTSNVVAETAWVDVDVRIPRRDQAESLERRFRELRPFDDRTKVVVEGGLRRPPMERSAGTAELFDLAQRLSRELGAPLEEAGLVGGGSDGNFTAAAGAPTLDGLGAVGEGAHTPQECVLIDRIADRAALLAKLIAAA